MDKEGKKKKEEFVGRRTPPFIPALWVICPRLEDHPWQRWCVPSKSGFRKLQMNDNELFFLANDRPSSQLAGLLCLILLHILSFCPARFSPLPLSIFSIWYRIGSDRIGLGCPSSRS